MPFIDSLDIANRALQICEQDHIQTVSEDSVRNFEASFAYDKLRRQELRRNQWKFSVRKAVLRPIDTNTMLLKPDAWLSTTTYLLGAIVKDDNNQLWMSSVSDNLNNTPGGDNESWDAYFGPLTVHLYDNTEEYSMGELVYAAGANAGSFAVYMSMTNANTSDPETATAWAATTTYRRNQVVSRSGSNWRSRIEFNLNVTPADGPADWDTTATYAAADTVTGTDDFIYSSVGNGNTGNDPVTDGGVNWTNTGVAHAWDRTPTLTTAALTWRSIDARIESFQFMYPISYGPMTSTGAYSVFHVPAGHLRYAPAPKQGAGAIIGSPGEQWEVEGDYLVSPYSAPFVYRFVADVTRVSKFDDLFCEGLACRIATAIAPRLTQSGTKLQTIASMYKLFMGDARKVNAIEVGPVELAEDPLILCRL